MGSNTPVARFHDMRIQIVDEGVEVSAPLSPYPVLLGRELVCEIIDTYISDQLMELKSCYGSDNYYSLHWGWVVSLPIVIAVTPLALVYGYRTLRQRFIRAPASGRNLTDAMENGRSEMGQQINLPWNEYDK